MLGRPSGALTLMGHGARRRGGCGRVKVAARDSASVDAVADDYYEVLGLVNALNLIWVLFGFPENGKKIEFLVLVENADVSTFNLV